ncbi:MAG: TrkH family potassium uptake protein [Butyricicoccaceae bacterium]
MRLIQWLEGWLNRRRIQSSRSAARVILQGFAVIVLIGTGLLMLPFATKEGMTTTLVDALFTATSAACVNGLAVVDTYTHWTLFGQIVIMLLIQIGGLGFMSMMTIVSFLTRRRISIHERVIMSTEYNTSYISGIVRLTRNALMTMFGCEAVGAVLLSVRFARDFGVSGGIRKGIFTAISAFCNAGFDLMGQYEPSSSMVFYEGDLVVCGVLMALIIVGGLGVVVWSDCIHGVMFSRGSLHTRIVLLVTALLIVSGTVIFYILEGSNPDTIGSFSEPRKWLAALFQSVTLRTAGFTTFDQAPLTRASVVVCCILMFIGGSPGSTAGGIKTVTFAVLMMTMIAIMRGKRDVNIFGRRIPPRTVLNAFVLMFTGGLLVITGITLLAIFEPGTDLGMIAYEVMSAFSTAGMSQGLTGTLSSASRVVLIILMYLGRVGLLTLAVGVFTRHTIDPKIRYPEARLMIG